MQRSDVAGSDDDNDGDDDDDQQDQKDLPGALEVLASKPRLSCRVSRS
jgi:hypothetical protein